MVKINRGRLSISANIVLTASLITRTFTFGFIMMSILMKVNNDILNEDVIKIIDMEILAGMPLGTTVKSVVFSFIGVFVLELVSGIFGIWGAIGRKKRILAVTFTFGFIMMSILMKVNNDILNEDVIKIIDMEILAGMPLGTTVKSVVFSFIGVFVLELFSGIFGIWGAIGRKKRILAVNVLMSSIMIVVYLINIVNISIIYNKKTDLNDTLSNYTSAYQATIPYNKHYISYTYWEKTFPNFLKKLGCQNSYPEIYHCRSVYVQKLDTYLEIYIGIIVTCIVCQVVTIVAAEYTFRKLEFKEKKPSISENKYYLLLSLKHGIFRSLIIFIKENWNRSKVVVASVLLKVASLTAGVGLLGLGLTLLGDEFINNSSLKHIFYKLQFHNYYFYDILVGLVAASVVLGTVTSTVAVLGLVGSWKKSSILLVTNTALSLVLHVPRIIAFAFWIFFIAKISIVAMFLYASSSILSTLICGLNINSGMKFQLWLQQLGYFIEGSGNEITTKWNDMIMTLQCCGVNHNNETYTTNGITFCCKNAHPRILDSAGYNTNSYSSFDYLGGCGGYKTETCAEVILFKTKMFVGWFLAIVLLQIVLEIIGFVFVSKEYLVIMLTKSAGNPTGATLNANSVIFRKMVKEIKSFSVSNWKRSKISLVHFISLGCLFIFNIVVLCLAINIRFDKVFGNSDVQELFSRINVTDQIFTRSINIFSIVTVTFSSVSIAVAILSIFVMVLPKWKSVLSFVSAGVLCIVAVANLLQEGLWVIFFNNVSSELEDELMKQFNSTNGGYDYSDKSATRDWSLSLSWNTLFVQAECCGVGPMIESSFKSTYWYLYDRSAGQRIPVQCCISQTNVFPYSTRTDSNCTTSMLDGYYRSQSCDVAVKERLEIYSTIFIVFMAMIIFVEICCVVTTLLNAIRFKKDTKMMQVSVKAGGKGVGIRKDNATQKVGDNAKKKRNQRNKEDNRANRSSKNELRLSVRTVDLHKKANTIVQENIEDIIELQSIKSMEFEDKVNDKPDKPTDNIRQEVDELARNDITMPDN